MMRAGISAVIRRLARQIKRIQVVTILIGLIGGVLGLLGFLACPPGPKGEPPPDFPEALLQTLRLFTLNVDPQSLCNSQTWWASLAAPMLFAGVFLIAFGRLLWPGWCALRLWLRPANDLFLGGGDTATAIARRRQDGKVEGILRWRTTVLDPRREAPLMLAMEEGWRGVAFALEGDAVSDHDLELVNAGRAGNVWVITGDDLRNLEVARRVSMLVEGSRSIDSERHLLVHVQDRHLARASKSTLGTPSLHIEYFNMPRLAARALLLGEPPPYLANGVRRTGGDPLHLCIVGANDLGCAIATHAAVHCVYDESPEACVRITLVGNGARARYRDIIRRHPALDPRTRRDPSFAGVLPIAHLKHLDCDESEITPGAWQSLQAQAPFSIVYVVAGDDLSTRNAALRVAALRERDPPNIGSVLRIVECLRGTSTPALPTIIERDTGSFHIWKRSLEATESYPGEQADHLAKAIRFFYESRDAMTLSLPELQRSDVWKKSGAQWVRLEEEFRWSDRYAADHIAVKLALVGLKPAEFAPGEMTTARERELQGVIDREDNFAFLARLEHRRFLTERLMDGWLPLPEGWNLERFPNSSDYVAQFPSGLDYSEQKKVLKLNRTLIPLDAFPGDEAGDHEKEKDRAPVRAIPRCLMLARIVRESMQRSSA